MGGGKLATPVASSTLAAAKRVPSASTAKPAASGSTASTVAMSIRAPKPSACSRMRRSRSRPPIPTV